MSIKIHLFTDASLEKKISLASFFDAKIEISPCPEHFSNPQVLSDLLKEQEPFIFPDTFELDSRDGDKSCVYLSTAIAKDKALEEDSVTFEKGNESFVFTWEKENFESITPVQTPHFLEQSFVSSHSQKLLVSSLLLFFTIFVFFLIKRIRKYLLRKKEEKVLREKRQYWQIFFLAAKERSEFEEIYKYRRTWTDLIPLIKNEGMKQQVSTDDLKYFYDTLNKYQYKQTWTDEERLLVENSFLKLRKIFSVKEDQ